MRFLLAAGDAARWPFERVGWSVERRLLWPLQRRFAGRSPSSRGTGAAALGVIGVAAILVAALILPGSDGAPPEQAAESARVAIVPPQPRRQSTDPQAPSLQGVPPHFSVSRGVGVANADGGEGGAAGSESAGVDSRESGEASPSEGEAAATASGAGAGEPVPAGPAAMKVARRFSDAFVFYEIGRRPGRAKAVFGETATPQLAEALAERPPRLPPDAKVPKAKVVNLVPGPRAGRAYTVSVSLLRVGLTSELRLELNKQKGQWLVTDVRG